jgi:hypothetical protein
MNKKTGAKRHVMLAPSLMSDIGQNHKFKPLNNEHGKKVLEKLIHNFDAISIFAEIKVKSIEGISLNDNELGAIEYLA